MQLKSKLMEIGSAKKPRRKERTNPYRSYRCDFHTRKHERCEIDCPRRKCDEHHKSGLPCPSDCESRRLEVAFYKEEKQQELEETVRNGGTPSMVQTEEKSTKAVTSRAAPHRHVSAVRAQNTFASGISTFHLLAPIAGELDKEELIPIKLDIVVDGIRVQDCFTWNLYEKHLSTEHFTTRFCMEMDLPEAFEWHVEASLRRQIHEYEQWKIRKEQYLNENSTSMKNEESDKGIEENGTDSNDGMEMKKKKNRHKASSSIKDGKQEEKDGLYASSKVDLDEPEEELFLIKLNITLNGITLTDQFEWDTKNPYNSPEEFSRCLCQDMGLSREFQVSISHSIREQLFTYQKTLLDHPMSTLRLFKRPVPILFGIRAENDIEAWSPTLEQYDATKLKKGSDENEEITLPYEHLVIRKKRKVIN